MKQIEGTIKFKKSRSGDPMAIINNKPSFIEGNDPMKKCVQVGQTWGYKITGQNPKGSVYFITLTKTPLDILRESNIGNNPKKDWTTEGTMTIQRELEVVLQDYLTAWDIIGFHVTVDMDSRKEISKNVTFSSKMQFASDVSWFLMDFAASEIYPKAKYPKFIDNEDSWKRVKPNSKKEKK